ncbi:MAG: Tryptophan--tRNA ligase, mitochondrial [Thelocarpon superellum]|nr:MAG: Tryptophan--tRNA ligase, mitochondrial [Thelocarpon superellum]
MNRSTGSSKPRLQPSNPYGSHATSATSELIDETTDPLRKSSAADDRPKVIFSGIQPTGIPHLGNYLGALRPWVELQNSSPPATKLIYSIVDLHALTVPHEAAVLRRRKRETLAVLLAVGLDPERSIIFYQSAVAAHTELMWMLSCSSTIGYLSRMTQWKTKVAQRDTTTATAIGAGSQQRLGLFSYPVLQAADILVHGATHVPVGEDQVQHLEFARDLAGRFNAEHGSSLPLPQTLVSAPGKRIMSLRTPSVKMSKSHGQESSRILVTDSRATIEKKIKNALTDSEDGIGFDPARRPGVSNLVLLVATMRDVPIDEVVRDCQSLTLRAFKDHVARILADGLDPIRHRFGELLGDGHGEGEYGGEGRRWEDERARLADIAQRGAQKARENAETTMREISSFGGG